MHETFLISMWYTQLHMAAALIYFQCLFLQDMFSQDFFSQDMFIVMSGWFLLASSVVQYLRKIKLLN